MTPAARPPDRSLGGSSSPARPGEGSFLSLPEVFLTYLRGEADVVGEEVAELHEEVGVRPETWLSEGRELAGFTCPESCRPSGRSSWGLQARGAAWSSPCHTGERLVSEL